MAKTQEEWVHLFEERAAIIEFDGKLPRWEAEVRARLEVEAAKKAEKAGS